MLHLSNLNHDSLLTSIVAVTRLKMSGPAEILADFRSQVTKLLQEREEQWEASRRLVGAGQFPTTLKRLMEAAASAEVPAPVRNALAAALQGGKAERIQDLSNSRLKELTGLPPTKALRALCVWFDLLVLPDTEERVVDNSALGAVDRPDANPFDLLISAEQPSVLDLGAGDLSFAEELGRRYAPAIKAKGQTLILHCVDRLHPQSRLGGPLHPSHERLESLRARPDLSFQFFADQDLCALERLDRAGKLSPRYTVAACWAPATPTFAYEPTRLSPETIARELQRTKGTFHKVDYAGEAALEVQQGGRALLFPPWKFEVRGPLALLDVISRRGQIGLLGAVDDQVFWETLAELLDDPVYRPHDQPFTQSNLPAIFGTLHDRLSALEVGEAIRLSDCAPLRRHIPRVLPTHGRYPASYSFSTVHVRRGAEFEGIPASSTARRFRNMVEESPPWMITLIPRR